MFILFRHLLKPARLCGGRPLLGRLGCLLEAPGTPWETRGPKAAQRHSKETVWVAWGCLLEVSGLPLGGLRAPKGTPKSLQGRGQYEASDLKLTQTDLRTEIAQLFPTRPLVLKKPRRNTRSENNLYLVFGRFPVELGPETRSNGSGSKNGAERTQN